MNKVIKLYTDGGCRGHAGNEGNEIADRLCNEAMDEIE